jgi:DNA-binding ferritin-like protein (Dps family)
MNKRISELVEQAGFFPTELTQVGPSVEKLAEMIVKECLAECWYDATPKQIADNIRQKFGVE